MNNFASQQEIEAASAYEALFIPALVGEWGPRAVAAAQIQTGERVLDVGCGTGIVAREVAARVGSEGYVAGVDPSRGMLAVAERLAPDVDWREGTAESLPFPDRSFDAVVSQFGLMFFSDRRKAVREMLRVLAPAGRVAVVVWDSLDNNPAYASEVALLDRLAGKAAADALRAPFVLGDRNGLAVLFEGAGFGSVTITTERGQGRFPGIRTMVEADLRGWLPVMGVDLAEEQIEHILEEAEHALRPYVTPEDGAVFETSAHIVTGIKT